MMDAILSDLDYRKTKWRLRRGLLELDILLENFAEESLRHLRYEEMYELNQCLEKLLPISFSLICLSFLLYSNS